MAIQSNSPVHNHFWQHMICQKSSFIRGLLLASVMSMGTLGLVACEQKTNTVDDTVTKSGNIEGDEQNSDNSSDSTNSNNSAVQVTDSEQPPNIESNSAVNNQEEQGAPVTYDVENWQTEGDARYEPTDLNNIQQAVGQIISTDKNSLDYTSKAAVKYRFVQDNQPYLDLIDSQEYLEFGWYYANPNDSDVEKQTSIEHAKKIYQVANHLMGAEGKTLVSNILTGQVIKNKQVGGKQVELAKCEFYSCMLILKK